MTKGLVWEYKPGSACTGEMTLSTNFYREHMLRESLSSLEKTHNTVVNCLDATALEEAKERALRPVGEQKAMTRQEPRLDGGVEDALHCGSRK